MVSSSRAKVEPDDPAGNKHLRQKGSVVNFHGRFFCDQDGAAKALSKDLFMAVSFKGAHFPASVILYAVFFYVRYAVSYRDLQEIMAEGGVTIDHATRNLWAVKYSPMIAAQLKARKRPTATSWRDDEA